MLKKNKHTIEYTYLTISSKNTTLLQQPRKTEAIAKATLPIVNNDTIDMVKVSTINSS